MAENTKIQWTDHTFNPWIGCAKVNEGCANCYAENLMANRYHRVVWGPSGTRSKTKTWRDPVRWNSEAGAAGEFRKVFCASLADVFEDREELVPWRKELFQLIDFCKNLTWLLLTKRPENIRRMWPDNMRRENVWLGTSIANQKNADEWIDRLLASRRLTPCLFLSLEPQVGSVRLTPWLDPAPLIDWVIVGGESNQGSPARPFHFEWAETVVMECMDAMVPCFVKQMGSNPYRYRSPWRLKDGHGGDMAEWPHEIRVRACPETFAMA
jgi:protein gp37